MSEIVGAKLNRWKLLIAFVVAGLAVTAQSPTAQPVRDTAAGKRLAEQYCVSCHVIVPSGQRGWTDAPSFQAIAGRPGVTAAQLSAVIQQPHTKMLNDQRRKTEADAIAAYIVSLRKR